MDNNGVKRGVKRRSSSVSSSSSPSSSSSSSSSSPSMGDDDRISKLPDAVLLHIMSFLPTQDVVRTCILSKRWKLIWYSVPTLFFSNTTTTQSKQRREKLSKQRREKLELYNYVEKYLEHRKKGMYFIVDSVITSFKLEIIDFDHTSKGAHLDKWLAFLVENKVREIHLLIGIDTSAIYCLPKTLDNATYLTVLELQSVVLDPSYSLSFPFLKTLSLVHVRHSETAKDDVLCKILLGCPSLEKLRVHYYDFLCNGDKLPLRSSSLKFLELIDTYLYDELQVVAINLESLVLNGASVNNIDLSACKKIRNLSLDNTSDDFEPSLHALISNNPLLENLTLSDCFTCKKHLKISSEHLKSFNFKNSYSDKSNITIESTPELAHFCYEGCIDLSMSIEPSNSLSGKIVIYGKESREFINAGYADYDAVWFTDMLNFLLNLNCSWNIVSLHVERYEALIWPEKLKRVCRSPLLNWKHLRVNTKYGTIERRAEKRVSDLKDSLMWISPSLETLSINKTRIF